MVRWGLIRFVARASGKNKKKYIECPRITAACILMHGFRSLPLKTPFPTVTRATAESVAHRVTPSTPSTDYKTNETAAPRVSHDAVDLCDAHRCRCERSGSKWLPLSEANTLGVSRVRRKTKREDLKRPSVRPRLSFAVPSSGGGGERT